MAGLNEREIADRERLVQLIDVIGNLLIWLLTDTQYIELERDLFRDVAFRDARDRLYQVSRWIRDIQDSSDPSWRKLNDAGLLGDSLRIKRAVGKAVADRGRHERTFGGILAPLLRWMNSILGSLASVFPQIELVKELKDMAELAIPDDRPGPPPPEGIIDILA